MNEDKKVCQLQHLDSYVAGACTSGCKKCGWYITLSAAIGKKQRRDESRERMFNSRHGNHHKVNQTGDNRKP